ncbi:unnamed protein product [Acanthoscelides obtectus]|uniref:Uncharacterized protein n=1 Tax=Acanthoscelides obtectus TaxID=200917 RepID=A0A9P0LUM0_ACAOB|nr:unnamed protein product [Acanthoscelides obtectus]CAK1642380.1 hypothetical protein AOBTE_LOCUS13009 [Acanthoscelides obtectus]
MLRTSQPGGAGQLFKMVAEIISSMLEYSHTPPLAQGFEKILIYERSCSVTPVKTLEDSFNNDNVRAIGEKSNLFLK